MKAMKQKKGQASLYVVFILAAIIIVILAGVLAPMGIQFTSVMVAAGSDIMLDANESISSITNTTIRDSIQGTIGNAYEAADDNIDILGFVFQYAWVVVLLIVGIIVFIYSRRMVEFSQGGII